MARHLDFLTDKVTVLDDMRPGTTTPYLDVKTDEIYYLDRYGEGRGLYKRSLFIRAGLRAWSCQTA